MASQPARFTELLSSSVALVRERFNVILPGLILFVLLNVALMVVFAAVGVESFEGNPQLQADQIAAAVGSGVGIGVLMGLIGIVAYLYFLLAITQKQKSFGALLSQTFPMILPMIWISILTMVKSFTWIALLGVPFFFSQSTMPIGFLLIAAGVVCGIVFGPRYMLAPVIWVVEKTTASKAVDRSYQVTTGYWGKVVGNLILLGLIAFVVALAVGLVAGILDGLVGGASEIAGFAVSQFINTFAQQVYQVVMIAFLLKMSVTLIAHPRTAAKKK